MDSMQSKGVDLFETQKQVIKAMLDEKQLNGEIKSNEEYKIEYDNLIAALGSNEPIMKVREQSGITNPRAFNDTMDEVAIDTMTLFSQINQIDETVTKHQQLNQSMINNMNLMLKKAEDEVSLYEATIDTIGNDGVVYERFRDANSFEGDLSYGFDGLDGQQATPDYVAKFDVNQEAIKLPTIISEDVMIGASGVKLGRLSIGKQLGGGLVHIQNPENLIDKATDSSYETFWAETVMADKPIRVQMDSKYYNIKHGALCEIFVQFDYLTQLNELSLIPFCEFPMDILGAEYFTTDNELEIAHKLDIKAKSSGDAVVYQFEDVYVKRLRIVLNQRHFVKTDFILNNQETEQLKLWYASKEELNPDGITIKEGFINQPLYQNKAESSRGYVYYQKALKNMSTDINDIVGSQSDDSVTSMTKFAYTYGLYNLGFKRNEYQNKGFYTSKEIDGQGNIERVSLSTDEIHPEVNGLQFTDIEYSIRVHGDYKAQMAIVPKNKEFIRAERLTIYEMENTYLGEMRFLADGPITVRRNGIVLYEELGDYSVDKKEITLRNYEASSIYTVDYKPVAEAYEVDFLKYLGKPLVKVEESYGTNALGSITLSEYPYIERDKLNKEGTDWNPSYLDNAYVPIKVRIVDVDGVHYDQPNNKSSEGAVIRNMTNYFDVESTQLLPYSKEAGYQYRVSGNQIIFNTPIPETSRIIVEYPHLFSKMRIQAILRRNLDSYHGLTPILNEYTLWYKRLM